MKQSKFYQVKNITEQEYTLVGCDGSVITRPIQDIDKSASAFTIQDAKDGDVLMANAPFIFNGNLEGGIGCPGAHCAINTLGKFQIPKSPRHWTGHTTTPATKEQRDTIFKAMHEAGYEWDAENKKLKKIEQKKDVYNKLTDFETSLKHIMEEAIECGDTNNLKADADMLLRLVQKPAWSEEDKEMSRFIGNAITTDDSSVYLKSKGIEVIDVHVWLNELKDRVQPQPKQEWSDEDEDAIGMAIIALDDMYNPDEPDNTYAGYSMPFNKAVERLKSLRDRVQPKQEWSEEDENRINRLIAYFEDKESFTAEDDVVYVNWLKSLKERYTWKPSDYQLEALESATENCAYSEYQDCLRELIVQLKKLKG